MSFDFNKSFQSLQGQVSGLSSSFSPFAKRTQRLIQEKLGNADEKVRTRNLNRLLFLYLTNPELVNRLIRLSFLKNILNWKAVSMLWSSFIKSFFRSRRCLATRVSKFTFIEQNWLFVLFLDLNMKMKDTIIHQIYENHLLTWVEQFLKKFLLFLKLQLLQRLNRFWPVLDRRKNQRLWTMRWVELR